jgi:DNA-binding SARP family transcriptional activator/lipopolysaccharide biosynthesis regulator YciM
MINNEFDELFRSGRYDLPERWINLLPEEIKNNNDRIRLNTAMLLYHYRSDHDSALAILELLIKKEKSDTYISSCIIYSDILLIKGKGAEAVKILEKLLKSEKDPVKYTKISLELAKAYYSLGAEHYDKIIKLLDKTLKHNDENNLREFHSEIYSLYGRVYQNRGEFSKSLHYFKNVVQIESNIFTKFQTLTNIVLLHAWSAEYVKAKEFLDKTEEIYRNYHAAAFKRSMLRINALFKFEAGDYEESIKLFSELSSYDISLNIKTFQFLYYLFIAESYILLGKRDKANEYIGLADKAKQADDEFQNLMINYHKAIIDNIEKPSPKNEKILIDTHSFMKAHLLYYPLVQVEFHLADFYYKTGNLKTCIKYLNDSMKTSAEKQFSSYLSQLFQSKRFLFDFAIANNIQKEYISSIHTELLEKDNYYWLSDDCIKRIKKDFNNLYDITLNCFGGAEIFSRGIAITEDKWLRKKSKLLLIYLLINREFKHTKEKILELFFSDLSATSADNVFHQAITNIRNAVNPGKPAGHEETQKTKKSKQEKQQTQTVSFITYEDKILQVTLGYLYKVDAVEFSRLHGKIKSLQTQKHEKIILAKKAIEMYKGEFLPGYYDDWIEELRTAFQYKFIEICEELITLLEADNNFNDIIYYSEKLISADKLHEGAFISLINAYANTGNENMAKKKFSQLLKNYDEEYGEKPSKETLSKIEDILLKSM